MLEAEGWIGQERDADKIKQILIEKTGLKLLLFGNFLLSTGIPTRSNAPALECISYRAAVTGRSASMHPPHRSALGRDR